MNQIAAPATSSIPRTHARRASAPPTTRRGKQSPRSSTESSPGGDATRAGKTSKLEYCKIFPPIGIARVGNSPEEFFVGPEAPGLVPDAGGTYKDAKGRIKRQAARFRVYGFGSNGEVSELTLDHAKIASIRWGLSLANLKADSYQFDGAARVAAILRGDSSFPRRNPEVAGEDRRGLRIGPIAVEVEGAEAAAARLEGSFSAPPATETKAVYLGEARTDAAGRLLVLGGHGDSATLWPDNPVTNYANNDGWHDDVADGPVTVEVTLKDGRKLPVRGRGWVIVAPPHFSPHTENVVTLHDVLSEMALEHGLAWNERELGSAQTRSTTGLTKRTNSWPCSPSPI